MRDPKDITIEEFKLMTDLAGLGMDQDELEELKPIYDLYAEYAMQLHTLEFGATEMVVEFRPDWPES